MSGARPVVAGDSGGAGDVGGEPADCSVSPRASGGVIAVASGAWRRFGFGGVASGGRCVRDLRELEEERARHRRVAVGVRRRVDIALAYSAAPPAQEAGVEQEVAARDDAPQRHGRRGIDDRRVRRDHEPPAARDNAARAATVCQRQHADQFACDVEYSRLSTIRPSARPEARRSDLVCVGALPTRACRASTRRRRARPRGVALRDQLSLVVRSPRAARHRASRRRRLPPLRAHGLCGEQQHRRRPRPSGSAWMRPPRVVAGSKIPRRRNRGATDGCPAPRSVPHQLPRRGVVELPAEAGPHVSDKLVALDLHEPCGDDHVGRRPAAAATSSSW